MTISIWRYSHLILAISTALFIIITSITGIILAFEPILNKLKPFDVENINKISISETLTALEKQYKEVIEIEIDENNFVSTSVITKNGKNKTFYINPKTGLKIGKIIQKKAIFEFATNLHRSLFLKSTGRFLIGFVSFLLFLIAVTGVLLIIRRQGGACKFFSKITKENSKQYYHIIVGRYALIPIIIINLTGAYLSLEKFSLLPKDKKPRQEIVQKTTTKHVKVADFNVFKTTYLNEVKKIEFPFSSNEEDYFLLKLRDKELAIHQYSGEIICEKKLSSFSLGTYYSLFLHTGKGTIIWSIVLLLTCFAILFFIFSGFSITVSRRKKFVALKNEILPNKAEYIVLVGSETGSTIRFAMAFKNALLKINKTVFIAELNNYKTYKKAKNIVIFTATYGNGEPPTNANKFIKLIGTVQQNRLLKYTVVGFGSKEYPAFCQFAIFVHASLQIHPKFIPQMTLIKINHRNMQSFKNWVNEWSVLNNLSLKINEEDVVETSEKEVKFSVLKKTDVNKDNTFLIFLKPNCKTKFVSGDVLSITPKNENKSRLYSIAKIDKYILLSVKKHEYGVCSNYLQQLQINDFVNGVIKQNKHFYLPKKAKEVILIANGTGIAPFLGMILENSKTKIHLFWGGRTPKSFEIYNKYITKALDTKKLTSFYIAYSQEKKEKNYVQNLLEKKTEFVAKTLQNQNCILICGSLKMQQGVEIVIDKIAKEKLNLSIKNLKDYGVIKTNCY
ncbi:PepSY domain-containing protein [Polaribacter batillariae]|uniref:NADPH--hemoprotein reductase n=1 Tax=Polaribacter batillariae TaxID=2808900 RepID=A0ABX7SYP6_9FLAO|nr:PepSY domain-containing protein [Polaribacter batillariae]QTD38400.1 PepSY domain-containing protein [Polaribacter batillariae]